MDSSAAEPMGAEEIQSAEQMGAEEIRSTEEQKRRGGEPEASKEQTVKSPEGSPTSNQSPNETNRTNPTNHTPTDNVNTVSPRQVGSHVQPSEGSNAPIGDPEAESNAPIGEPEAESNAPIGEPEAESNAPIGEPEAELNAPIGESFEEINSSIGRPAAVTSGTTGSAPTDVTDVSKKSPSHQPSVGGLPTDPLTQRVQLPLKYTVTEAVPMIQRAWRRYIDMQVYRYYRDLVSFQSQGNPVTMLKCINPQESALLDAAAGVHLKFRLAGDRFPPNIYYKIFTHRPIQDLCANAPRDYTRVCEKKDTMATKHNRTLVSIEFNGDGKKKGQEGHEREGWGQRGRERDGWYQRVENNGWRLVSDRLLHHAMNDPVTWASAVKPVPFQHSKALRIQDLERKKKKRKVDWLKKMYSQGMLKAKSSDSDTVQLIEGAAEGMIVTVEREGIEGVHDWEVNELLDWTSNLNYDQYVNSWTATGASSTSDFDVVERQYLKMLAKSQTHSMSPEMGSRDNSRQELDVGRYGEGRVEMNDLVHARNTPASPLYSTAIE